MRSIRLLITLVMFAMLGTVAQGGILNVPDDFETIQGGIDAAEAGDTVLVQPGRYQENLLLDANAIIVGSLIVTTQESAYIDSTIIDGNDAGSVVVFSGRARQQSRLRGFTITGGHSQGGDDTNDGGGIVCDRETTPILEDLLITDNVADGRGGGVHSYYGSPIMRRVRIESNTAVIAGGANFS